MPRTLVHKIEDSQADLMITLDLAAFYPRMAEWLALDGSEGRRRRLRRAGR